MKACALFLLVGIMAAASPVWANGTRAASRVALGANIFQTRCSLCHDNSEHMINDIGPALFGVAGRRIGSVEGYNYTPALQDANLKGEVWTDKALDSFLTNPSHLHPGTGMPFWIPSKAQRAGVIAYLKTLRAKP